jgi:PmbA protein
VSTDVDLLALAEKVVAEARAGEQLEVYVASSRRTTARVRGGELEALESAASSGVGVRVVVDGRQGFASTGSLDAAAVARALADARDNVTFAEPDDGNGLAEPDGVEVASLPGPDAALAGLTSDRRVELAVAVERAALATDPRISGVRMVEWSDAVGAVALASTTGLRASDRSSRWSAMADLLATDAGETQEAHAVRVGRRFDEVEDGAVLEEVGREAAERAVVLLGATQPRSRRCAVVLDPHVAGSFLSLIGATLVGDAVLKGRSPFAGRVGDAVASPLLSLVDDPTDPLSPAARRYDGEGRATRRNVLLSASVLGGFLHSTWSARKAGATPTGSSVRDYASTPHAGTQALVLGLGDVPDAELLRRVGDGIWVQTVSGLHSGTNPVSGDFSVGIAGRAVRDGELAEPVREATIASTLQRMLLDVVGVSSERVWLPGGTGSASLAIDGVSLSGS